LRPFWVFPPSSTARISRYRSLWSWGPATAKRCAAKRCPTAAVTPQ
jgi:hypothetical protein